MSNANDPAYPAHYAEEDGAGGYKTFRVPGLTKREAFAMAAMQGILAGPLCQAARESEDNGFDALVGKWAGELADATLAELAKGEG